MNSSYFSSGAKYIHIPVLNSSDLSVSKSSSGSISDIFKGIDIKVFPKSMKDNICSIIAILYSCHDPCRDIRTSANQPSANGKTSERELTRSQLSAGYKRSCRTKRYR